MTALLFWWLSFFLIQPQFVATLPATHAASGGWTYLQSTNTGINNACTVGNSSCTITIFATTTGTAWAIQAGAGNNIHISSVSGGGGSWVVCPASACATTNGTQGQDMAYNVTGNSGTTSVTVTMSGTSSGFFGLTFYEFLPPMCGAARCVPSFDGGAAANNGGSNCATCTLAAPTVSATDMVVHNINFSSSTSSQCGSPPYELMWGGSTCLGFNVTSSTAPTLKQASSAGFADSAISFKSSGGSYTFVPPPAPSYSLVSYPSNFSQTCNPGCNISFSSGAIAAGDLLWLQVTGSGTQVISSISGTAGTWVIPASCQITHASVGSLSCAYVLSSNSVPGGFADTITMSANCTCWVDFIEAHRSTGSFAFDTAGTTYNSSASTEPAGQTLTLAGGTEIIFQGIQTLTGLPGAQTLYYLPAYGNVGSQFGGNNNAAGFGSTAVRLNTNDGTAPTWLDSVSETSIVYGIAFK